jgi:hypothetical protein
MGDSAHIECHITKVNLRKVRCNFGTLAENWGDMEGNLLNLKAVSSQAGCVGAAGVSRSIAPCLRNGVRLPAHTPFNAGIATVDAGIASQPASYPKISA